MQRWQTLSLFSLSELVCTKNVFYPIVLFPLLSHPKLLPLWSIMDREISTPISPSLLSFSTERAGPYPHAQLYWAGRTMGWMADWTSLMRVLKHWFEFWILLWKMYHSLRYFRTHHYFCLCFTTHITFSADHGGRRHQHIPSPADQWQPK